MYRVRFNYLQKNYYSLTTCLSHPWLAQERSSVRKKRADFGLQTFASAGRNNHLTFLSIFCPLEVTLKHHGNLNTYTTFGWEILQGFGQQKSSAPPPLCLSRSRIKTHTKSLHARTAQEQISHLENVEKTRSVRSRVTLSFSNTLRSKCR